MTITAKKQIRRILSGAHKFQPVRTDAYNLAVDLYRKCNDMGFCSYFHGLNHETVRTLVNGRITPIKALTSVAMTRTTNDDPAINSSIESMLFALKGRKVNPERALQILRLRWGRTPS